MKLGIMQPYFFPYLGYFNLIHSVDLFIIYDVVQYLKRSWINRNRILHQNGTGWQYVVVPVVKDHQKTTIMDIRTSPELSWQQRILGQLSHYQNKAFFTENAIGFVGKCLDTSETSISRLNVSILGQCAHLLELNFQHRFCSELDIDLNQTRSAEERILDLCEFLGAKEYVNLPGGVNLYHRESFKKRGIKLTFLDIPTFVYRTGQYAFEPNLSIIDLLMWNRPEDIKKYLDQHQNTG